MVSETLFLSLEEAPRLTILMPIIAIGSGVLGANLVYYLVHLLEMSKLFSGAIALLTFLLVSGLVAWFGLKDKGEILATEGQVKVERPWQRTINFSLESTQATVFRWDKSIPNHTIGLQLVLEEGKVRMAFGVAAPHLSSLVLPPPEKVLLSPPEVTLAFKSFSRFMKFLRLNNVSGLPELPA